MSEHKMSEGHKIRGFDGSLEHPTRHRIYSMPINHLKAKKPQKISTSLANMGMTLTEFLHGTKSLLIVGSTTTDKYVDVVLPQAILVFFDCADDAMKCCGDVREVSDTTTDKQNFAWKKNKNISCFLFLLTQRIIEPSKVIGVKVAQQHVR